MRVGKVKGKLYYPSESPTPTFARVMQVAVFWWRKSLVLSIHSHHTIAVNRKGSRANDFRKRNRKFSSLVDIILAVHNTTCNVSGTIALFILYIVYRFANRTGRTTRTIGRRSVHDVQCDAGPKLRRTAIVWFLWCLLFVETFGRIVLNIGLHNCSNHNGRQH